MAGSVELITPGYGKTWRYAPRTYGGRAIDIGKISDKDGSWSFATAADFAGGLTKAGAPVLAGNPFLVAQVTGLAAPGAIALAGAVVGDKVLSVIDMFQAPAANISADFESVVSVAGQLQQTTATDLHTKTACMVTLIHQS